jgi:PST family polysaccharide transporter
MADQEHSHPSLKRTLFWAFAMNWGTGGLGTAVSLVLAVVLGPTVFGLVSIALVFVSFTQILLAQGIEDALVQRSEIEDAHFDSAFWMVIVFSLFLMGFCIAVSDLWAVANHQPIVADVLRALSVRIPIYGLTIVQQAVMVRKLDFKALAYRSNLAEGIGGMIAIGMAVCGFGLWSLVGQQLGRDVAALAFLWRLSSWRPRLSFSWRHIKDLIPFSSATFIAALGSYVHGQVDTLLIGLFFGPTAVGLYRFADRIQQFVLTSVSRSIEWVSLPSLAKFQGAPIKLKQTFLSLLKINVAATAPIMISLAVASDIVVGMLGPKWHAASDAIWILCLMGSFQSVAYLTSSLLRACSRPMALACVTWAFGIFNAALVLICGFALREASIVQQVNGVALCKLAGFVLAYLPVSMVMAKACCHASYRDLAHALSSGAAGALAALLVAYTLKHFVLPNNLAPAIALGLVLTFALIGAAGAVFWIEQGWRTQLMLFMRRRIFLSFRRT